MYIHKNVRKIFNGLYRICRCCHCDCLIPIINKGGRPIKYKHGHHSFLNKRKLNHNWKGGKWETGGYRYLNLPDYHGSDKGGRIGEHVYIYEQYHNLCMLKWGQVHHINKNTLDNDIDNLQGMMNGDHQRLHRYKDMSNRSCFNCGSKSTTVRHHKDKSKWPNLLWCHLPSDKINWYCHKCSCKLRYKTLNEDNPII